MSHAEFPTDHLRDDAEPSATSSEPDAAESTSGEGITIGGQLGALPQEAPTAGDDSSDSDDVGDIDPSTLDGSADAVEQEIRENGAP